MTHLPGPPHEQQPPPPKPSSKSGPIIGVVFVLVLIIYAIVKVLTTSSGAPDTPSAPISTSRSVVYEITGSAGSVSLTARSATGTEQASGRALPATISYQMEPGAFSYVSAQNEGESGAITCTITVDGQLISSNRAEGGYTIATCEGRVP